MEEEGIMEEVEFMEEDHMEVEDMEVHEEYMENSIGLYFWEFWEVCFVSKGCKERLSKNKEEENL